MDEFSETHCCCLICGLIRKVEEEANGCQRTTKQYQLMNLFGLAWIGPISNPTEGLKTREPKNKRLTLGCAKIRSFDGVEACSALKGEKRVVYWREKGRESEGRAKSEDVLKI